jgi:diguanylate cyclase (GGDEF)-like protein
MSTRVAASNADAVIRSALARREAAVDRVHAARDREAGATERTQSELDRDTSLSDRGSGALERGKAGSDRARADADRGWGADGRVQSASDRDTAHVDRSQATIDLTHASLDGLTGVYTRSAGLLELQREIDRSERSGTPLAVAFVDVDGLKAVNDAGGHAAGDRVLVRVAEALHARLRPYDLVIRYGGDEFLCALGGLASGDAAVRLRAVNVSLAEGELPTSVSVGVSELRTGDSIGLLIDRADGDLYRCRSDDRRPHTR